MTVFLLFWVTKWPQKFCLQSIIHLQESRVFNFWLECCMLSGWNQVKLMTQKHNLYFSLDFASVGLLIFLFTKENGKFIIDFFCKISVLDFTTLKNSIRKNFVLQEDRCTFCTWGHSQTILVRQLIVEC